jgi:hypothetical protein
MYRCAGENSILLEAASPEGSGVLLRVRYRDSLVSGSYPVTMPGDTGAGPAAIVAVRYFVREASHGFVLDSGTVNVERRGGNVGAHIKGSGIENGIHTPARIEYRDVPLRTDTVTCAYQP